MTRKRYFLLGGILTAVTLAALLILGNRPVVRAAEGAGRIHFRSACGEG